MSGARRDVQFPNTVVAISPAFSGGIRLAQVGVSGATPTMRRLMGIAGAGLVWCAVTFIGNPVAARAAPPRVPQQIANVLTMR